MKINDILWYKRLSKTEKEAMDIERTEKMRHFKERGTIKDNALIYFNNVQYKIRNGKLI